MRRDPPPRHGCRLIVINPRPDFVERVRLHQQIAGTAVVATPLAAMLRDGITAWVGTVHTIGDGSVILDDGTDIGFDYAFLAVGSTVRPIAGTVPVGTWEGAESARVALWALPAGSRVTVIGGGATGVETAAEVAETRPDLHVRIVGPSVAGDFSHRAYRRVRSGLERRRSTSWTTVSRRSPTGSCTFGRERRSPRT